mmetsp:Transcript_71015/g.197264  ORF Transcript_71015/g.197264 Transcript_71015/m.197264 type:complete len:234 (+) Transcript_71015:459-1160(+)
MRVAQKTAVSRHGPCTSHADPSVRRSRRAGRDATPSRMPRPRLSRQRWLPQSLLSWQHGWRRNSHSRRASAKICSPRTIRTGAQARRSRRGPPNPGNPAPGSTCRRTPKHFRARPRLLPSLHPAWLPRHFLAPSHQYPTPAETRPRSGRRRTARCRQGPHSPRAVGPPQTRARSRAPAEAAQPTAGLRQAPGRPRTRRSPNSACQKHPPGAATRGIPSTPRSRTVQPARPESS